MPENISLSANKRDLLGKKVKFLRKERKLPAVVYGSGIASINLSLDYNDFIHAFKKAGESTLIDLNVDQEKPVKVIVQDVVYEPVSGLCQHVDFYQVRMDKKLKTKLSVNFTGESPAVKELGAVLVKNIDEIEIECLPNDLQHQVDVDLSALKAIGDKILVSDLKLSDKIEVLTNHETVVALVEALHVEEVAATTKEAEAQAIEAVAAEKEKKAEEEGASVTGKKEEK